MNKATGLAYLYPEAVNGEDYTVRNGDLEAGESGQLIENWNPLLGPIPSDQELADAELEAEKLNKKNEADAYGQNLIDDAYGNPQQGISTEAEIHKRRTESRRKDKADKQAGEITLTEEEKNQSKTDQKLSEYETKCWDASDKVHANIDKEDTVDDVMAIDVETNTTWPIWEPPV